MKVILIVDVQKDFVDGSLAVPGAQDIVSGLNGLNLTEYDLVIATQDYHPAFHISFARAHKQQPFETFQASYGTQALWPDHCVIGTDGVELVGAWPCRAQYIVRKGMRVDFDSYSAFRDAGDLDTNLGRLIAGHDVDVCGLATDYCVKATALDAVPYAKSVRVLTDLCRAVSPETGATAIEEMRNAGIAIV